MAVGLGRGEGQAKTAFASVGGSEESLKGEPEWRRGSCRGRTDGRKVSGSAATSAEGSAASTSVMEGVASFSVEEDEHLVSAWERALASFVSVDAPDVVTSCTV